MHEDLSSLKETTHSHFKSLFTKEGGSQQRDNILDIIPCLVTIQMNQNLKALVTRKEIKCALHDMNADKAPGPDGFTICFIKSCSKLIKRDLHWSMQYS